MFVFISMSGETIYCECCKQRFDIRGYQGHIRSKKHIRALHLAEKKAKRKAEQEKDVLNMPADTKQEESKPEPEPEPVRVQEAPEEEPKTEEDIEDLEDLEEPEEEPEEQEERDYMTIRIIDGKEKPAKSSGIDKLIDMLATPETIAMLGQVVGQILAAKVQTAPVIVAPWGHDDKGNVIQF
jgi:hypothetical protein